MQSQGGLWYSSLFATASRPSPPTHIVPVFITVTETFILTTGPPQLASQVNAAVSCGNPIKLPTILFAGPGSSAQCLLCGPPMRSFQSLTADFRGDQVQPEPAASSMTCTLLEMFCSTALLAHNGTLCALHKQMLVFTLLSSCWQILIEFCAGGAVDAVMLGESAFPRCTQVITLKKAALMAALTS